MSLVEKIEIEQQKLGRKEERKKERARKKAKKKARRDQGIQKRKHLIKQHTTYDEYLNTVWWKRRKYEFRKKYPNCYVCGSSENLHTHHIRYQRGGVSVLYQERDTDLRTTCESCHKKAHYWSMERIFKATGPKFKELKRIFMRLPATSKMKMRKDEPIDCGPFPVNVSITKLLDAPRMPPVTRRKLQVVLAQSIANKAPNPEPKLNEGFQQTSNPRILVRKNRG